MGRGTYIKTAGQHNILFILIFFNLVLAILILVYVNKIIRKRREQEPEPE